MRTQLLASALIMAAFGAGCDDATAGDRGAGATRDFPVTAFTGIGLGGCHDVIVTVGGKPSVRAQGDPQALDRLEIEVVDGDLRIDSPSRRRTFRCNDQRDRLVIHVTSPTLTSAAIGGSGTIRIDRAGGESFAGSIGGSGSLRIGALRAQQATFSIGGSGTIMAAGSVGDAGMSIAGSGNIDASDLVIRSAKISIAGSGSADAHVSTQADISIAGSGNANVRGTANCKVVDKVGSGSANCRA